MKVDTEGLGMTISRIGSDEALRRLRLLKHGPRENWGWNPVLRERFGSYTPDDYYETCLDALVDSATEWIDVGGGATVLESNPPLARLLGQRCKRLVAVDPSSNVQKNALAHERVQDFLE